MVAIAFSILVGFSLSQTIRNILNSVLKLKDASNESSRIGSILKDKSQQVSAAVSSQVSAIEQTSASMEEIHSLVTINSQSSDQAHHLAHSVSQYAKKAETEVDGLLGSMGRIAESSKKIISAVGVIDDIAIQTNLLALNASVEAARAGELGRGFAVVADAVRTLAQKSAIAAKEINHLIQENAETIEKGRSGANKSAEILKSILEMIQKLNLLNTELAQASKEQATGIEQVSHAMNDIEAGTHQTSENLVEIVESAEILLDQSRLLQGIVHVLQVEVRGERTSAGHSPGEVMTTTDYQVKENLQVSGG